MPKNNKIKNKMKKPEIIIEKGRETDELTALICGFYKSASEYNKEHADHAHVVVLARDSKGGTGFMIGDIETCAKEFLLCASRHESFLNLLKWILDELQD